MEEFFAVEKFTVEGSENGVMNAVHDLKRAAIKAAREHGVLITDEGRSPHGSTFQQLGTPTDERLLEASVSALEFSPRIMRLFEELNIESVSELLELSSAQVTAQKNYGPRAVAEINSKLIRHGLPMLE